MKKTGKWHCRRFYSKLERLLVLEKKCMGNLVQVERALLGCLNRLTEESKGEREHSFINTINKISNEFAGSLKTHAQLQIKMAEAQSRLSDILRAKEDSPTELEMMFYVLESGLRQTRTGFLSATCENPIKSPPSSPLLHSRHRKNQQGGNADDTLLLVTNNPFESTSTSTDLRDDIDEEEGLGGELKYEDLSVENYSNPFGASAQRQNSPSPPPLRGVVSANGAQNEKHSDVTPPFVSSEKCRQTSRVRPQMMAEARGMKKAASSTPVVVNDNTISSSATESSLSSMKLPAVSPMATPFLKEGEVFRQPGEEEKSKKKKRKDGGEAKPGKKKKPKTKEKGKEGSKPKVGRVSPLEEAIRKFNVKGAGSASETEDSSDTRSEHSSYDTRTPVRKHPPSPHWEREGFLGYGDPGSSGSRYQLDDTTSSKEDVSDNDSLTEGNLPTYHNPFGGSDMGGDVGGPGRGADDEEDDVDDEDDDGKWKLSFRGSVIDGKKKDKVKKKGEKNISRSPRAHRDSPSGSQIGLSASQKSFLDKSDLDSRASSISPPTTKEAPTPAFVSLSGLVDLALYGDPQFRRALVLACSHFSSAAEVISVLKQRFLEDERSNVTQQKVLVLLSYWIENSYFDLIHYEDSLFELIGAIQEHQERWGKSLFTKLSTKKILFSDLGDQGLPVNITWDGFSEGDLALTVTHAEAKIFQRITPTELLAWNTKKKATHCPAIHQAISFSTRLSGWITSELVKRMKLKERARLLEKFILLGEHLLEYRNFSGCMAVLGGLTSSAVWRMKKTWARVSPEILSIFQGLKKVMSHTSSYASYRAYLKGSNPPRIPFLGVNLSDLTFIDDGNKTKMDGDGGGGEDWEDFVVGEDKYSVSKCLMLSKVISEFQTSQNPKYCEVYPPAQGDFMETISSHRILSEEEAHKLSLFAEPKDPEEAMEKALDLHNIALKKIASLEKELGRAELSGSNNPGTPIMSYSPPLFRLPEVQEPSQNLSEAKLKSSSLKRMPSSPLRPMSKRTFSQSFKD